MGWEMLKNEAIPGNFNFSRKIQDASRTERVGRPIKSEDDQASDLRKTHRHITHNNHSQKSREQDPKSPKNYFSIAKLETE